ncbi:putative coniferyl aldehyde dehydrogenase [Thalassotalea profundi]|uniref:Aldehyde dehydrogenase n=2 Tax=Thalassotalea profundi TaxID=2036687 RepID=A0ABQ3IUZ6_9GAMM|nr:coniferyl aldehyde dehydrogenase [Thalassotalea profundi]GHE95380.1 putative coniferyl aldehyde dehydrogenase [Thalassotalea profundi]
MNEVDIKTALNQMLTDHKNEFSKAPFPSYQQRIGHLHALKALMLENQDELISAMSDDFGNRSADDSKLGDILTTVSGINYCIKQLKKWMKPEKRHVGLLFQPASARVEYQPLGIVGIMVPWNYPIFLALGPLTTALAAGNRAMIKMSEFTPKTSALIAQLIPQYLNNRVSIIEGDASVAAIFSGLAFDHLFFTGSTNVGKMVMKAAAENLVPVTLELGGKSPAIIDDNISLHTAVERLIMGKTLNSGQTCVAPDYILCPKGKADKLSDIMETTFKTMFPTIKDNADYTSVVNDHQHARLLGLIDDARSKGATIKSLSSDTRCEKSRQLPLTLLLNVNDDMTVMQQEIFGPLLPIVEYQSIEEAITYVNERERPLALYICSFDTQFQNKLLKETHSGGVCINDAAMHVGVEDLPFGGVGSSGMGNYHGIEGFKTFSHAKAIFSRGRMSMAKQLFPPYGTFMHKLIYKFFIR